MSNENTSSGTPSGNGAFKRLRENTGNSLWIYILLLVGALILLCSGFPSRNGTCIYWGIFLFLLCIIWYCNDRGDLLKDTSNVGKKPYSYARVQMAWWTLIIVSSYSSIFFTTWELPNFNSSNLILLGIGVGTTAVAAAIDVTDKSKNVPLIQDQLGDYMLLDILSDKNGISLSRLQAVIFNVVIGAWYIKHFNDNLANVVNAIAKCPDNTFLSCRQGVLDKVTAGISALNGIMPAIAQNNLILMGVSAGTYAALKTTENATSPNDKIAAVSLKLNIPDTDNAKSSENAPNTPLVNMKNSSTGVEIKMEQSGMSKTSFIASNVPPGNYDIKASWELLVNNAKVTVQGSLSPQLDNKTSFPLQISLK